MESLGWGTGLTALSDWSRHPRSSGTVRNAEGCGAHSKCVGEESVQHGMASTVSLSRVLGPLARLLRMCIAVQEGPRAALAPVSHAVPAPRGPVAPVTFSPLDAPSETAPPPDYFISYTGVDREWAAWIAWQLEDSGFTVVLQEWDFRPGHNFLLMMDRATRARQTVIVLSAGFLEAGYTQPEWARAMVDDPQGLQRRLVPVRVSSCEVTGLLRPVIYVDLVGLDAAAARSALLDGVRPGRAKPSREPRFPGGGVR